jgi:rRNA biogenesis protein RRP5
LQVILKKFGSKSVNVWVNYAHFLHMTLEAPDRARALLPRATQALDKGQHLFLITKFAALEFRSPKGEAERGRTMYEGLFSTFPKKYDLWNQLLDLEMGNAEKTGDDTTVRDVFERGSRMKSLKPKQAEKWFRRWAEWEEKRDPKGKAKVLARAEEWTTALKARKAAEAAAADD